MTMTDFEKEFVVFVIDCVFEYCYFNDNFRPKGDGYTLEKAREVLRIYDGNYPEDYYKDVVRDERFLKYLSTEMYTYYLRRQRSNREKLYFRYFPVNVNRYF